MAKQKVKNPFKDVDDRVWDGFVQWFEQPPLNHVFNESAIIEWVPYWESYLAGAIRGIAIGGAAMAKALQVNLSGGSH